jgi:hypothetical protein
MQTHVSEARDGAPGLAGMLKLPGGFPKAYDVAFEVAEPGEGAGGDRYGRDHGFAAGGFDLLEAGGDVVGFDVEVGELVGLVA